MQRSRWHGGTASGLILITWPDMIGACPAWLLPRPPILVLNPFLLLDMQSKPPINLYLAHGTASLSSALSSIVARPNGVPYTPRSPLSAYPPVVLLTANASLTLTTPVDSPSGVKYLPYSIATNMLVSGGQVRMAGWGGSLEHAWREVPTAVINVRETLGGSFRGWTMRQFAALFKPSCPCKLTSASSQPCLLTFILPLTAASLSPTGPWLTDLQPVRPQRRRHHQRHSFPRSPRSSRCPGLSFRPEANQPGSPCLARKLSNQRTAPMGLPGRQVIFTLTGPHIIAPSRICLFDG